MSPLVFAPLRLRIGVRSCAFLVLTLGCGAEPEARAPRRPAIAPIAAKVAPDPAPPPAVVSAAPPVTQAPAAESIPPLVLPYVREIDDAVSALALEKPPHAAALGLERVFVHDGRGWRAEPLPRNVRPGPSLELSIFYGRDERVRLVGTRIDGAGPESVYLRWLPEGFRKDPGEIGRLGASSGALCAVLGTLDPEIVCRPGDICLVKRRTGWATVAAPADLRRVALGGGVGWAIAGRALLRLDDGGWQSAGPAGTWESADALFATRDRAWVVETDKSRLHAFDGAGWTVTDSPIAKPRALWGANADALWLVGDDGLASLVGGVWRRAVDAPAPLAVVTGRAPDDVWIGGAKGVFRVGTPGR